MRGLTAFSLKNLKRRKARYALTALGIVLGVGNVFGVFVANASTSAAIERNTAAFWGGGDVSVVPRPNAASRRTNQEEAPPEFSEMPSISERDVATLKELPDIAATSREAVGWLFVEPGPKIASGKWDESKLILVGHDLEFAGRSSKIEEGRWYRPRRHEVIVTRSAARTLRLDIGDEVTTPRRGPPVTVVGIMRDRGEGRAEALTSVEEMHRLVGHSGIASVQLYLRDNVEPDVWTVTNESRIPHLQFFHSGIPREFLRFINVIQTTLGGAAAIAIFVGAFLIYLTFTMAVIERTRMYGTLHAVGATSGQVRRVVLTEALGVGVGATIVGLALGMAMAVGLIRVLGSAFDVGPVPFTVTPLALGAAVAVGLFATLVGAFVPARRAARLSPVEAIRVTPALAPTPSRTWIAGIVAVAAGFAVHFLTANASDPAPGQLGGVPVLLVLFGSVLLVPPLVRPVVRATRSAVRKLAPRLGGVATMHLIRERSRSAYTLGLLMVVLAMMLSLGTTHTSMGRALDEWVRTRFGADLLAYSFGIDAKDIDRVSRVEGVDDVAAISFGRVQVTRPKAAGIQNVVAIDQDAFFRIAGFPWAEGSTEEAIRALDEGGSTFLPASSATRFGLDIGDVITVETAKGSARLTLAATYASIAAGPEIGLVVSKEDGRELFGLRTANVLYIDFDRALETAPARGERVEQEFFALGTRPLGKDALAIRKALEDDAFVIEGAQIKAQAERNLATYFGLFLAVLVIAVVIGLLGLANTMTTSIVQRFREIGVLQAVGAGPGDLRRMVLAEVAALVGGALVLSLAVGFAVSWMLLNSSGSLLGFEVPIIYPWRWIPALILLAVVVAVVAAVAPSRRAERLTPVEALRYE